MAADHYAWMDMRVLLRPRTVLSLPGAAFLYAHVDDPATQALLRADPRVLCDAVDGQWCKVGRAAYDRTRCRLWLQARRWFWALGVLRDRLLRRRRLAVAMACHARLGRDGGCALGELGPDLLRFVSTQV